MNLCSLYNNDSKKRNRKILAIIGVTLIIISFLFSFSLSMAKNCTCDAVRGSHKEGEVYPCTEGWDPINKYAFTCQKLIFSANPLNYAETFTVDFTSGSYAQIWNKIEIYYNSIKVVGCLLVVLYFLLEIIESTTKESFTVEHLIKLTIKLFIALLLIQNGLDLLKSGLAFGNALVDKFVVSGGGGTVETATLKEYYNQYKEAAWYETLGSIVSIIIPYLGNLISYMIILLMVYSRYIDIIVRAVFAPIGMANIYEGGLSSSGMKYFKKYMASVLQGVIMVVITAASSMISKVIGNTSTLSNLFGISNLTNLIVIICTAMAIIKSKSWANDLMGV